MPIKRKTRGLFDSILRSLFAVAGIILIFDMLIVTFDVVMRYTPLPTILWVVEIAEYSMLFIVFLGTAWVLKRGEHVRIDLLVDRLHPRPRVFLEIFISITGSIVFLTVSYYAAKIGWAAYLSGDRIYTMLEPLKFPFMFTISIGSLLLSIQFLRNTYNHFRTRRT